MSKILSNLKMPNLLSNVLYADTPLYVQYYVTARCNLRCEQCNVIYANADVSECSPEEALTVIRNLGSIGTQVLLLTGGEPFMRKDLPHMVKEAIKSDIHPRIQTNGFASEKALEECVSAGAIDISISLDSMKPTLQDAINGGFDNTWLRAMQTISNVSRIFPTNSFAAFGCVLAPSNLNQIENVIRFATEIGWWVSLVPAHSTDINHPRSFSTFDQSLNFPDDLYPEVEKLIGRVKKMKKAGFNVYDSDQYLDDILRFVTKKPVHWRDRNDGVCDSPGSYFAVLPNGHMAVCCDWRFVKDSHSVVEEQFPARYKQKIMFPEAIAIASKCSGCMYGSYPEITVTQRFANATMSRIKLFVRESQVQIHRFKNLDDLLKVAQKYE